MKEKVFFAKCSSVKKNGWVLLKENEVVFSQLHPNYAEDFLPTVGDDVFFVIDDFNNNLIVKANPRKNQMFRIKNNQKQTMAANVDVVFVVASMNEDFNIPKLERLSIIANIENAKKFFVLTKKDLCKNPEDFVNQLKSAFNEEVVFCVDATNFESSSALFSVWKKGESAIFVGSSGVGKSTLVNTLEQREIAETGDVRKSDSKGKHTTTSRNLFVLSSGRIVIDTPGIKSVGIDNNENSQGIEEVFSTIKQLEAECKFSNCTHTHEKFCAVKNAIENNIISQESFERYLQFKQEQLTKKQKENAKQKTWQSLHRKKKNKK